MKLYIAGPMTGYPAHNADAFHVAVVTLRAAGYQVVTPIEVDRRVDPTFLHRTDTATPEQVARFQAASMCELATCDGVAMIPGWRESRGTQQELDLACSLCIPCGEVAVWVWVAKNRRA